MDKKILRLLIADDSPDDVELAVTSLRQQRYMLKHQRVHDLASLQAALDKGLWDVVVSEYQMPHFGAQMALDLLKRAGLDLPLIVLTRQIDDDGLVKIMRAGACDVVPKTQVIRLAPVIERELAVATDRRALREARERLGEYETQGRAVIEGTREALCYLQDGMHVDANAAYLALFGYQTLDELTGIPVLNLIDKADHPRLKEYLRKTPDANSQPQEFNAVKSDGARVPVEFTLSSLQREGEQCLQLLVSDISKRKAAESRLQYLNQHDPLTGLFNRQHFMQELGRAVERARNGETAALFYLDLQQIKNINDALGYAAGDRVLIKVAKLLRELLGEAALLARFGGDEFAALMPGLDEKQARTLSDKVTGSLKKASMSEGDKTFSCECHITLAIVDRATESAQKILALVYQPAQAARPSASPAAAAPAPAAVAPAAAPPPPAAKPTQTARPAAAAPAAAKPAAPATPIPAPVSAASEAWRGRLTHALEKGRFTLIYQPIVNLHAEPAEFFEVLVRLVDDDGSLVPAGEFIPAAQNCGLMGAIDLWVLQHGIEALASLHRDQRKATFFFNLSRAAFRNANLLPSIIGWLRETNVKPKYLVFEADEPDIIAEPAAFTFAKSARRIGARIAIDGFGLKLGPTDYLRELPAEFLKIDASLIRGLPGDAVTQSMLRAVLDVARNLNMKTIAKSVEKAENLAALWNFGIDYVQGHYFGADASGGQNDSEHEATLSSRDVAAPNWATPSRR